MTRAVLTPRAVWWRARAPVGLSKLCQLLALSAWHGIAQERSAGSSIKQISALTHFASAQSPAPAPQPSLNCSAEVPCRCAVQSHSFRGAFSLWLDSACAVCVHHVPRPSL